MFDLLRFAAPVALASLGETIGQRAGALNIGLEGTILSAAFAGMMVTRATSNPWLGLLAGIVTGLILGLAQSWFVLELAADPVVVGTAINLGAMGVTGALFRQTFGQSGQLLSIPALPRFGPGLDLVLVFLLLAVAGLTWALFKTPWGLKLRAVGEYPLAAVANGYSPLRIRRVGLMISSAFAGLAGAYLSVGIAASFQENMSGGRGFIAIAMVTFGRFHPVWAFAASLVIGFAEILQFTLQARGIQAPAPLMLAMPYLLALVVLILVGPGQRAPRSLGAPLRMDKG